MDFTTVDSITENVMVVMMITVMILRCVLMQVGQMQLLRRQIAHQLHTSCKFNSKFLASALNTMNEYDCSYADIIKITKKTTLSMTTIVMLHC